MSRTGEVVLGVISAIFNVIGIIFLTLIVIGGITTFQDEEFTTIMEQELMITDPTMTAEDVQMASDFMAVFADLFSVFGWVLVFLAVVSLVFNILGIVFVSKNKNAKRAGVMFIIAGVFAGIISLTSILLYVAAIMCFVRKPPVQFQEEYYAPDKTL